MNEEGALQRALYDLVFKILNKMLSGAIENEVKRIELERYTWDRKELARQYSRSVDAAIEDFFSDPRMIAIERRKANGKCYYNAEKAKEICDQIMDEWEG
ncbi:hypothetical protein I6N96_01225 [Enterococcus sp. BWM-S5]|uniref:Uncharacterized protein n=1 Tax=Enterococcus larvae TaxID=2794352 RepID=A0ABS4CE58_9ENTE|nr:hypothetical protein [Enterococcus larvae]MBP1044883.1 hypothetical protein [Enterococcus larvae]